jgi:two-component SAPR family response regulator
LAALNTDNHLDEGVNYISKPYTPEKLAKIVRRRLDEAAPKPAPLAPS